MPNSFTYREFDSVAIFNIPQKTFYPVHNVLASLFMNNRFL